VVVLIAANHQYAILRNELRRNGAPLSERAEAMTSLDNPRIDWVRLAEGYGVRATRAATTDELTASLRDAFGRKGPTLIEMAL
jgi:acetolactate synthase I/II/III large subunit